MKINLCKVVLLSTCILILVGTANAASAMALCGGGARKTSQEATVKYSKAEKMLSHRESLTKSQQVEVVELLESAHLAGCPRASVSLAVLKMESSAALDVCSYSESQCSEAEKINAREKQKGIDDEVYKLLKAGVSYGEGEFEYGMFHLIKSSAYYSPKEAKKHIELSGKKGDQRAVNYLINAYLDGRDGFQKSEKMEQYWRERLVLEK